MFIIAESGSTKTEWVLVGGNEPSGIHMPGLLRARTEGVNPAVMEDNAIAAVLSAAMSGLETAAGYLEPFVRDTVDAVYFYGAGFVKGETARRLESLLCSFFPKASVECSSDLLAAARSLWGKEEGIVAILGTGSNSCLYDGTEIVRNIRPGGYVLGDEGGGTSLGRIFLSDYIKDLVPDSLAEDFRQEYGLGYGDIVAGLYGSPNPAAYLASFAPYIVSRSADLYIDGIIRRNFRIFMERSLSRYGRSEVRVAGSLGNACRSILCEVGREYGLSFTKFDPSPVDGLVRYHMMYV